MDFNVLSTQNWSQMFNVWVEDIQVVCLPVVTAPFELQHGFLRKVRSVARYTSLFVIFFFSLHCTRPRVNSNPSLSPADVVPLPEPSVGSWKTPSDVYLESGPASWYGGDGDSFAGRITANGETYNPAARTCAHRTLPFGTLLEVENIETGARVTVRVNDRGPFTKGRILDVSKRAATTLGMMDSGVVDVRMRSVDASGRPVRIDPELLREDPYTIQVAALADPGNIEHLSKELSSRFGPVTIQDAVMRQGTSVKRVRVGSFDNLEEAQKAAEQIAKFFKDRNVEPFITRQR